MTQYDDIDGRKQEGGNVKPIIILADRTGNFLDAALEGRDRHGNYVNQAPGAGYRVLTDAALVLNIPEGQLYVVTSHTVSIHSLNDSCLFQLGCCDDEDGGGTFHPDGHPDFMKSGAAQAVLTTESHEYVPPMVIRSSEGSRSVTFAVTPSGAGTTISCGFDGFFMEE